MAEDSTHTAHFDPATRTYTHSWTAVTANSTTTNTETSTFASVADFVDVAAVMEGRGGPIKTSIASNGATVVTTFAYDSQRRLATFDVSTTAMGMSYAISHGAYSQWDSLGRPTSGTINVRPPIASESCTDLKVTVSRNDSARSSVTTMSGGVNASAFGIDNCMRVTTTSSYDPKFIMLTAVHQNPAPHPPVVTDTTTIQATAVICK